MASPNKKPRDIKNLKARLGRTITPGQAGLPTAPGMPGTLPPPSAGGVPAPGMPGQPAPHAGVPAPGFPGGSVRPGAHPGIQPGAHPASSIPPPTAMSPLGGQPAPAPVGQPPQAAVRGASNPLGGAVAAPVTAEKKVTLVVDDSAVDQGEIGRKSTMRGVALIIIGALGGVALGWMVGSTTMERDQFNLALQDTKDIHAKVQETSKTLEVVKKNLKAALAAAQPSASAQAKVDYDAVQALVALEKPFTANEFHRRRYRAFQAPVVDSLFDYYNNINRLWDTFRNLQLATAGNKREALEKSAKAADGLVRTQYGAVLTKTGDAFAAGLVYVELPQEQKAKEGEAPIVNVASSQGGRSVERRVFVGQPDLNENHNKYVFMLDKMRSKAILGQGANLFGKYQAHLLEANRLLEGATESQGILLKELGQIAATPEQGMF